MKNWSDVNDYFNEIDEGYLTIEQFINYNNLRKKFQNQLDDDEIWSMANSNEV